MLPSRDGIDRGPPAAGGLSGHRLRPLPRGTAGRHAAGGPGRRGDQGGSPRPSLLRHPRGRGIQPRQAGAGAGPEKRRRPRRRPTTGGRRGRRAPELPPRGDGAPGPGPGGRDSGQPAPGVPVAARIWRRRGTRFAARLRRGAGRRHRPVHRPARDPSRAGGAAAVHTDPAGIRLRRRPRRAGGDPGALRPRGERPRRGDRGAAGRGRHVGHGRLPAARGRGAGALRQASPTRPTTSCAARCGRPTRPGAAA